MTRKNAQKKADGSNERKEEDRVSSSEKQSVKTTQLLNDVKGRVMGIYETVVDPLTETYHFRGRPSEGEITSSPIVVFLGNHSSGKSTFINYLLGEECQRTGVAPVDDGFTVISYSDTPLEQTGPAVVSNKSLPFSALESFGPQLVNHLRLKLRPVGLLKDVTLVDSPGMIDSAQSGEDRGFDFVKAVRWFAQRADYVLIFFDPEKPGTTGESLEVFTKALNGIEHKLYILLNKVDKFDKISDFSRAYGALCWNLAKVIPYKDMPYIFTTFVPTGSDVERPSRAWSLKEFEKARFDLIKKIKHAPSSHADNMITDMKKHVEELYLHASVLGEARRRLWWYRLSRWFFALIFAAGVAAGLWFVYRNDLNNDDEMLAGGAFTLAFTLAVLIANKFVHVEDKRLVRHLNSIFKETFETEIRKHSTFGDIWDRIEPFTTTTAKRYGLLSFSGLPKRKKQELEKVVYDDVPELLNNVHLSLKKQ
eukprot:TRINITY_DN1333_c0_g1_i1.p1 TRINITY_DN1333_c0_g1~~TRINITY_DN1333_c0_g1_i1.p1  ORF type:complete len:479 (-),score=125.54 TRINITY_DN1333_c0_g1_i1:166-1602(-)